MISNFFSRAFILLLSLNLYPSEFQYFENNGLIGLNLTNQTGDRLGITCDASGSYDGPYFLLSLKEEIKGNYTGVNVLYSFGQDSASSIKTWANDGILWLAEEGVSYGDEEFEWIENFMQNLEQARTLTIGREKSIREAKFAISQNKEDLYKFFKEAEKIDTCNIRSASEELRQIQAQAEAETEKAKQRQTRYEDFKSDVAKIIKENYSLEFRKPYQPISDSGKYVQEMICWGLALYRNDYKLPLNAYGFNDTWAVEDFNPYYRESEDQWWYMGYSERVAGYSEYFSEDFNSFCVNFSQLTDLYDFDDLNSPEYLKLMSALEKWPVDYWHDQLKDFAKVADLFHGLDFTLTISSFQIDELFLRVSNGFYEKWNNSEFIKIIDGESINDRKVEFYNLNGEEVDIKLFLKSEPYDPDFEGTINFGDEAFDWTAW